MQSSDNSVAAARPDVDASPVMNGNFIAPLYQPVEHICFGKALEQRRTAFLGDTKQARRALSCGEGDGRFLTALLQSNDVVEATAVDASRRMIEIARDRLRGLGDSSMARADFHCGRIGDFHPPHVYDLIATHFFLDCFPTPEAQNLIRRIAAWASPRAQWVVSEFAQPESALAHLWTGAVIRSLYAAFRVTTGLRVTHLPDYRPALVSAGFQLRKEERALGGLLVSELWERA